jgi:dCMP deaminase
MVFTHFLHIVSFTLVTTLVDHKMQALLHQCEVVAQQSPDNNRKVGCIITDSTGQVIVSACNDLIIGAQKTEARCSKPLKYQWIEHAERNAIYAAARNGIPLAGTTMYINWFPCVECCRCVIQSGISKLVSPTRPDTEHHRWGESFKTALQMLDEVGIDVTYADEQ